MPCPGVPGDNLEKFRGVERGASCLHAEPQSANSLDRSLYISLNSWLREFRQRSKHL